MLVYDKFFELLNKKGINKSDLRNYGFSPRVSVKLSKGEDISTNTLNRICKLLDCQPSDIMEYIPDVEYQEKILNLNKKGIKAVKEELHKIIEEDKNEQE